MEELRESFPLAASSMDEHLKKVQERRGLVMSMVSKTFRDEVMSKLDDLGVLDALVYERWIEGSNVPFPRNTEAINIFRNSFGDDEPVNGKPRSPTNEAVSKEIDEQLGRIRKAAANLIIGKDDLVKELMTNRTQLSL